MGSKVVAAQMASSAGIPTVIAAGEGDEVLGPILAGEARGTRFARRRSEASRRSSSGCASASRSPGGCTWTKARGARSSRHGREPARGRRRSAARAASSPATAVELVGPDGAAFGKGIAGAGAEELAGRPRGVEAVHRDRLVLY